MEGSPFPFDTRIPPYSGPNAVSIYALLDPTNGAIRYVGRSVRPEKRSHGSTIEGWPLLHWLDSIRPRKPVLRVLVVVAPEVAQIVERWAIGIALGLGCDLANIQHGKK